MSTSQAGSKISEFPSMPGKSQPPLRLNWLERSMVQHAHPAKLILDTVAYIWGVYFFGRHELLAGLLVLFGVGGLGSLLASPLDKSVLARTPLGKLFYVSAHPLNMVLQILGYALVSFGAWTHSAPMILSGVTLVLLGHIWGWDRLQRLAPG